MNPAFLVHGESSPPRPPTLLRAGPVTALLESDSGFLRRIAHQHTEVIRGIYGAVRDCNWGTVSPEIKDLQVSRKADSFEISFEAHCRAEPIVYSWQGSITGTRDGTITYRFDGVSRSGFLRNRIGLCVLHPLQGCVGQPCEVVLTDGTVVAAEFPTRIAPHQPFVRVRALRHSVHPGLQAEVTFAGEEFETEDQRNWTDASFKTYGTPLSLPFPVEVHPGDRVRQTVTLRFHGGNGRPVPTPIKPSTAVTVTLGSEAPLRRPSLGLGLPETPAQPSERQLEWLKKLRLGHLRAEVQFTRKRWADQLQAADRIAACAGTSLHLALHFGDDPSTDLDNLARVCKTLHAAPSLLLPFRVDRRCTPPALLDAVLVWTARTLPGVPVAAGTDAFFAELNRERPPTNRGTLPCFSLNPQVHARDSLSLVENLEAQAHAVNSATAFTAAPVVVSPITLRMRWNPAATRAKSSPDGRRLPPEVDARQLSLFALAWTLGSLSTLLPHPRVHALTYYETVGWRGLMETETGSPLPDQFPSQPGTPFPLYHVFHDLADARAEVAPEISHADRIAALVLTVRDHHRLLLVANLTAEVQTLRIVGVRGRATVRILDAANAEGLTPELRFGVLGTRLNRDETGSASLMLPPYAYVRVDLGQTT